MKALVFDEFGTSDVLRYDDIADPVPAVDEVLVRVAYAGLNFADIYRRRGDYRIKEHRPYIDGYEASGVVVGGDSDLAGRMVLFVDVPFANAELVAVPKGNLIFLPGHIDAKLATTIGLQGLTADFLAHDLANDPPGSHVFVTGVSGGVGQILAQMLIADGMEVSGSASTPEKRQLASRFGVRHVVPSRENDWCTALASQFDTVYDGLGSTLNQSIALIKNRGHVVLFGMAAGDPPPVDFVDLLAHSKSIVTGDLWDFLTSPEERQRRAERLFDYIRDGRIVVPDPAVFALHDGKQAHDLLESGRSAGKILLQP